MNPPLFKWDTLRVLGPLDFHFAQPVAGLLCEIELITGGTIEVWRSVDGQAYFCHGLTFGGKDAPGGIISPFTGVPVETILAAHYDLVEERLAQPEDIAVWHAPLPQTTPHSAILTDSVLSPDGTQVDYSTRLQTKNGMGTEENLTLEEIIFVTVHPTGNSWGHG